MARSGLEILLASFGLQINAKEVEHTMRATITNVNSLAAFVRSVDARLKNIEEHLGINSAPLLPAPEIQQENAANDTRKSA